MKRSTDRILTTHTGSLPRPPELLEELERRDRGEAVDEAALADDVRAAVGDVVRRQADAGVVVVNHGEAGKIGYSTYVTERLDGFGGEGSGPAPSRDMLEFPAYAERVGADRDGPAMPACVGPVSYRDVEAVRADAATLRAALDGVDAEEAFLSAASPGVIAFFLEDRHYGDHEARLVGRENVLASTDCGFASFAGSRTVDPEIVWAKLRAMADGAELATQRLW